ncbi:glycosyltransferase family 4 protein [Marinoscillum pacificum]|uniref:glycosyltransferase family 4 protein n=1 Tax=Marinoscillum pacificum TaxID=392723 RepID=UPI0021589A6B|nr:glycosyltransferase family 4 protein [Marinoscillum pacificum]
MKVLHVNLETHWGGGEKQLIQLIEGASTESRLFCVRNSKLHQYCKDNHLNHYCVASSSPYNLQLVFKFIRVCNQFKPDIIHLHTSRAHTLGVIVQLFLKIPPLVVTRRMSSPLKTNSFSRYKYNHPSIKKIICVSEAVRTAVSKLVDENKLTTIYGGVNISQTEEKIDRDFLTTRYPQLVGKRVIGFVGSLTDVKDPSLFIQAAAKISQTLPDTEFLMIGAGNLKDDLMSQVHQQNLAEVFHFTGFLKESVAAISSLDLLMITSRNEGIPNVILEAFVTRTPVVSVDVGGIPELIQHNDTGKFSSRESAELAKQAIELLKDFNLSKRLTENAYHKAQKFSYQIGIDQTIMLYEEVLSKN